MHTPRSIDGHDRGAAELRRSRVLRPWRWTLLVYGVALTVATHWPRLQLGPEIPASDKMIHMLAFGVLTLLLWRSGLLGFASAAGGAPDAASRRSAWLFAGLVAALWASVDELSQGIPGLGRTVSWHDLLANFCGVTGALALIWCMGPLQPPDQLTAPDRARTRLLTFTFDDMFATRRPWVVGAVVALACGAAIMLARPLLPSPHSVGVFGLVAVIVAGLVLYLIYRRMFFGRFARVMVERPCLACGAPAGESAGTRLPHAADACAACGSPRSDLDFIMPQRPPFRAVIEVSVAPALTAVVGVAAMFGMVLLVPAIYAWSINAPGGRSHSAAPRLAQIIGRLPGELNSVIDLTVYVLLIALVARMWRRRMAAYLDRAFRCRRCGHDLHGTPVNERGQGHCGECGEAFVRNHRDAEAQRSPRQNKRERG